MRSLRAGTWRWLGAVALGGGVLVGSAWYAAANHPTSGSPLSLVAGAFAQEAPTPAPAGPSVPAATQGNSRRPAGQVTQITTDPAGFTIRTAAGADLTFSVLETTVFMAGHDRPYRFELLKTGDQVVVRGGAKGKAPSLADQNAAAAKPIGNPRQARANRANPTNIATDGTPIARQVMVRPAGEKPPKKNKTEQTSTAEPAALRPTAANGGDRGAGQ